MKNFATSLLKRWAPLAAGLGFLLQSQAAHADSFLSCHPDRIIDQNNRFAVHCREGWGEAATVHWLALASTDGARLARFSQLANAAYLSGKTLKAYILTDATSNPPGCASADCRNATWFGIAD